MGAVPKCRIGNLHRKPVIPVQTLGDNTHSGTFGAFPFAFNVPRFLYGAESGYAGRRFRALGWSVSRRLPLVIWFVVLVVWLAACYGLRYGLMEDVQWVGACSDDPMQWQCVVRSNLGLWIHFGVFGWAALMTSVIACFVPRTFGRALAAVSLLVGILALVLYTANLAVFAVVIAGLRLVRAR